MQGDLPAIMEEIQKGDNPDDVLDEENINNKALDNLEADVDIPLPDTDRPEKVEKCHLFSTSISPLSLLCEK